MATAAGIQLETLSRYLATRVFIDPELRVPIFGTWRPPRIVETQPPIVHVVAGDEVTRPDLIAFRVYGNKELFWAIALRNNILFPLRGIKPGTLLQCPHIDDVQAALTQVVGSFAGLV